MKKSDVKKLIIQLLRKEKKIKTADIVNRTGFSRMYINRFLRELRDTGDIMLVGKANRAHYIFAQRKAILGAKKKIMTFQKKIKNKNALEDVILDEIKRSTGIFLALPKNVVGILD